MGNGEYIVDFRRRRKQNLIMLQGGKCQICGFDLFQEAQEFHHEDPSKKEYVMSRGDCHSQEIDLAEARKCFLLCANCHRGVHAGYYKNPEKHVFDEKLANLLIKNNIERKTKYTCYCIDCGREICQGSTRCRACAFKARTLKRHSQNFPTREELKQLIRTKPFTQIGEIYHVTDNAVRKWCDSYDLPRKKTDISKYSDKEWKNI